MLVEANAQIIHTRHSKKHLALGRHLRQGSNQRRDLPDRSGYQQTKGTLLRELRLLSAVAEGFSFYPPHVVQKMASSQVDVGPGIKAAAILDDSLFSVLHNAHE